MRTVITLYFLTFSGLWYSAAAQPRETAFEAVETLMQIRQKPVVVFIYTSWCTYCKAMDATTLKDNDVTKKLNEDFYFIRLNAEEKRDIRFLNRVFRYRPAGPGTGLHELAQELASVNGKTAYPVLCVLNEKYEIILHYNGYVNAGAILSLLEAVQDKD